MWHQSIVHLLVYLSDSGQEFVTHLLEHHSLMTFWNKFWQQLLCPQGRTIVSIHSKVWKGLFHAVALSYLLGQSFSRGLRIPSANDSKRYRYLGKSITSFVLKYLKVLVCLCNDALRKHVYEPLSDPSLGLQGLVDFVDLVVANMPEYIPAPQLEYTYLFISLRGLISSSLGFFLTNFKARHMSL